MKGLETQNRKKTSFMEKKWVRPIIEVSKWFLNMNSLEYLEKDNLKKGVHAHTHTHQCSIYDV